MSDTKTMVAIHLAYEFTPIQPHTPGSFVIGYYEGDREAAETYLNSCKINGENVLLDNAWLLAVGISFEPRVNPEMMAGVQGLAKIAEQVQEKNKQLAAAIMMNLKPIAQNMKAGDDKQQQVDLNHTHMLMPLTMLDPNNGLTYSVPPTYWFYPRGSMEAELGNQIDHMRTQLLNSRSSLAVAQSMPDELKDPRGN